MQPFDERYRSYVQVFSGEAAGRLWKSGARANRDALAEGFRMATGEDS